jgi:hypothetical protein
MEDGRLSTGVEGDEDESNGTKSAIINGLA